MTGGRSEETPLRIRGLLGIGLDGSPDEKRITRGENFCLFGGSKTTHERMTETALKFNEKVDERGKRLEEVNARELREITGELREELTEGSP
ncbi:MAG: hypothetical protein AMK73_01360 [Planctomycetes bacterium SM23_32]|nr:MAG: hypothetical protein AMK73_01360 [Planctomycetes bacterium SM23_32]